jgi:hypothetical protein
MEPMSHLSDKQIYDCAVIGSGPIGILISNLLVKQGKTVILIEAGDIGKETKLLSKKNYEFVTKSKIPESVHLVGGGSTQWFGRVGQFYASDYLNHINRIEKWPYGPEELDPYFKKVFELTLNTDTLDEEFVESNPKLSRIKSGLPDSLRLRLFRFSDLEIFNKLLEESKEKNNFLLKTNLLCLTVAKKLNSQYELKCINELGIHSYVQSKLVIIAGGTLQSTALLLRSTSLEMPARKSVLGHYLMEHFDGYVGYLVVRKRDQKILSDISLDSNRKLGMDYGVGFSFSSTEILKNCQLNLQFEVTPFKKKFLFESKTYVLKVPELPRKILFNIERAIRKLFDPFQQIIDVLLSQKRFSIWIKGEEFPNYDSNLRLSDSTGEYGFQDLVYDHQISEKTSRMLRYELKHIKQQLELRMLGKFVPYRHLMWERTNFYINPNWHPMGTTRMGDDMFSSICDRNLEVHCNKSVFLLTPGIFPTGSNQNPTAMTMAHAFRLAKHLSSKHLS